MLDDESALVAQRTHPLGGGCASRAPVMSPCARLGAARRPRRRPRAATAPRPRRGSAAPGRAGCRCGECGHEQLLAFSCKHRGFCPSCGARRMSQTAAHLVDHVIPHVPVRQWVLSLPIPLRVLLAAQPELVTPVVQVVQRVVTRHLLEAAHAPGRADRGDGPDLPGRARCRRGRGAHAASAAGRGRYLPHRLRAPHREKDADSARRDAARG